MNRHGRSLSTSRFGGFVHTKHLTLKVRYHEANKAVYTLPSRKHLMEHAIAVLKK